MSSVSGDVTVETVFVMDPSVFPVGVYDSILQQITNRKSSSPTTLSADFITGAEARNLYFPNNTAIRRFQLLHITRVHSQLATDGSDATAVAVSKLRSSLVDTASSRIGVCGVGYIADSSSPRLSVGGSVFIAEGSGDKWLMGLPAMMAPVALIGWIVTVVLCAVCWACACCSSGVGIASSSSIPLAEVVEAPTDIPLGVADASARMPVAGDTGRGVPAAAVVDTSTVNDLRRALVQPSSSRGYNDYASARSAIRPAGIGNAFSIPRPPMPGVNLQNHDSPLFLNMRLPAFGPQRL